MQWPLVPYASREPLGVGEKRRMRWVFEPAGLASAGVMTEGGGWWRFGNEGGEHSVNESRALALPGQAGAFAPLQIGDSREGHSQ